MDNFSGFVELSFPPLLIRIYTLCHSVFDFILKPLFASADIPKFKDERAHFRNSGMNGLIMQMYIFAGGPGLYDPCEKDPVDAAAGLSNQEREDITASAQVGQAHWD